MAIDIISDSVAGIRRRSSAKGHEKKRELGKKDFKLGGLRTQTNAGRKSAKTKEIRERGKKKRESD